VTSVTPLLFLQLNKLLTTSSSKKSNLQTHQSKPNLSKKIASKKISTFAVTAATEFLTEKS
jgi:hypothetical protein